MAHAVLALGQIAQAQAVATAAIAGLEQQNGSEPVEVLSLRGAFHLVLAIAAARDNDRPQAHTCTWTAMVKSLIASARTATTSVPCSAPPTWHRTLSELPSN